MTLVNSKIITVTSVFYLTSSTNVNINLPFIPTHMTIKHVIVDNSDALEEGNIYYVRSSLIDNNIFLHFILPGNVSFSSESYDLKYKMNCNNVNGTYSFDISTYQNQIPATAGPKNASMDLKLSMMLYFTQEV